MTTDEPTFKGEARLSWLLRQAGFLATKGASEEGINAFLQAENRVRCSPPLEPEEIQRVVSRTVDYEKSERGLRAVSIDEFRTAEERRARYALIDDEAITRLPSPRWTIDGILPEKGRSLWHAPPGRGKTFALLAAAFAIAAGDALVRPRRRARPRDLRGCRGRSGDGAARARLEGASRC